MMMQRLLCGLVSLVAAAQGQQFRFTLPTKQSCQEWAASAPMNHAGMGRRTQAMSGMDMGATSVGQVRRYYIAAEMEFWDYAPQNMDAVKNVTFTGLTATPTAVNDGHAHDHSVGRRRQQVDHSAMGGGGHGAAAWVSENSNLAAGALRLGKTYLKLRFVEYTDHTFQFKKYPTGRPADEVHLVSRAKPRQGLCAVVPYIWYGFCVWLLIFGWII